MLQSAKLYISNVNHTNIEVIRECAGIAGYALSVELIDDERRVIRMVWDGKSEQAMHESMIGAFAMEGFHVRVENEL
jgi:hypothetical protein